MLQIDEDIVEYQGRKVILDLAEKIAKSVNRKKIQPYLKQASKIRYLLKALDNGDYLTATQRDNILQGIISVSGMNEFPAAPTLENKVRPAIINGAEAATQTEVNNGSASNKYVSPATLAAWTGGGTSIQFQDEGVDLGNNEADTVDFVGAGVTATRTGDKVTVTIPGSSAASWGSITGTLSSQTDLQSALDLKANLASPTFTGTPSAPTAAEATSTTQLATTEFVQQEQREGRQVTGADSIIQTDQGGIIWFNSVTPFNFTIDELLINTQVGFINIGAGAVTFVNGSGVTLSGVSSLDGGSNASAVIFYKAATTPIIVSGSAAAAWGSITGTLSSQTDLQTALDGKVNDTGNETIAGVKTFSSDPIIPDEAYGVGWNGSLEPPTKNAVYDKIETLGGSTWGSITGTITAQTDLVNLILELRNQGDFNTI